MKKTQATSKDTKNNTGKLINPGIVLKNVPVEDLHYADYQRIEDLKRIKKIRKNLDWDIFGIVTVSCRDGKFYVVDGQHRIEAVRGLTETVPCQVWYGLTYEQEAEKFYKLNVFRRSLNAAQKFFANVEMGDNDAIEVVRMAKKYNFKLNKNNRICKENEIGSPKTLYQIKKSYSDKVLNDTLYVLRNAWCGGKEYIGSDNIKGVAVFLFSHPDVDISFLVEVLKSVTPTDIKFRVITNAMFFNNRSIPTRITQTQRANAICDLYNDAARKKNLRTVA